MDGTLLSRYENKYLIPHAHADRLRLAIQPFVAPDAFAARAKDHRYTISSLYLDSADLGLYQSTVEGHKNRFKLRIRSYADGDDQPLFCEIKRRIGTVVCKTRSRADRRSVIDFMNAGGPCRGFELFGEAVSRIRARPIARIRYEREAYESLGHDPVRITFDTDLAYAWTLEPEFSVKKGVWVPAQPDAVILEIKFTERFPTWVDSLLTKFELERCSVAKYVISLDKQARIAGRLGVI